MTDQSTPAASFVLWLDASDGSVPTHDGIRWPDGTATIHHRHFGITSTHRDPEAACQAAHGKQGRIVWPADTPTDALRQRLAVDVECAIGLNVGTGGSEGVEAARDAVLAVVESALRDQRDRQAEQTADLIQRYADVQIALREALDTYEQYGRAYYPDRHARYRAALQPPAPAPADLRQRIAEAIREATCDGSCNQTEEECAKERIQPFAWHFGKLAGVEGSPEQFADAVLAAVQAELDRLTETVARAENLRDKWLAWPADDMHHNAGLMLGAHLSGEKAGE
jgi:hypothetical protein